MKRLLRAVSAVLWLAWLTGCGGVLPSKQSTVESPWQSFDQAKASYDRIMPGETRVEDLRDLGFDPRHTPNMRRLHYLELIDLFMPHISIQRNDLDPALRACLDAREACFAYEISPAVTLNRRRGNVALDLFGFRRETEVNGWQFRSLIVLHDETVAYKLWSGEPSIQRAESERRPLGPLQNSGEKLIERAVY